MSKQQEIKNKMIVNTSFTSKSGEGTRMFSRQGRSTINHYLCFNESASNRFNQIFIANTQKKLKKEKRNPLEAFMFDQAIAKMLGKNKKNDDQKDAATRASSKLVRSSLNTSSFKAVNRNGTLSQKESMRASSPPTGHYKPVFSLVEKKINAFKYLKEKRSPLKTKTKPPECMEGGECSLLKRRVIRLKESGYTASEISKAVRKMKSKSRNKRGGLDAKNSIRASTPNLSYMLSAHERRTTPSSSVFQAEQIELGDGLRKRPQSSITRPKVQTAKHSRPMSPVAVGYHNKSLMGSPLTRSMVSFDKMKGRAPFVDPKKGPHEGRFQYLKIPSVLSSFHEASPPSFDKFKPRTNLLLKKKDVYLIDYDVNLNAVAKALGKRVPSFQKFVKRPEPGIHKSFNVPECYPHEDLEKAFRGLGHFTQQAGFKFRKKIIPMGKQLPRDDKMYNINEGYNLRSQKSNLTQKQRADTAVSMNTTIETISRPKSSAIYQRAYSKQSTTLPLSTKTLKNRRSMASFRRQDSPFKTQGRSSGNNSFAVKRIGEVDDSIPNFEKLFQGSSDRLNTQLL